VVSVSRRAWITILSVGGIAGLILGTPLSCWEAECPLVAGSTCVARGCDNLLGMTVASGHSYVGPILVSILLGVAVGWLAGLAISKLRSRGG